MEDSISEKLRPSFKRLEREVIKAAGEMLVEALRSDEVVIVDGHDGNFSISFCPFNEEFEDSAPVLRINPVLAVDEVLAMSRMGSGQEGFANEERDRLLRLSKSLKAASEKIDKALS